MTRLSWILVLQFGNAAAFANGSTLDAAIGGGLGGAAGAAIGHEVGGRDAAILGGALGAAVGTALTTQDRPRYAPAPRRAAHPPHSHSHFCPPGHAKKGRC